MENFLRVLFMKDNEVIALFGIVVAFFAVLAFYQAIKNDLQKVSQKPKEIPPQSKATIMDIQMNEEDK
ncbi:MAG TPA: hypothetical protein ACFYD6_06840 [Candidatus Brocadiia bacterium]|nr:hypothetical protein [Planctomycetota bacterium]MBI4007417.1 hypothetical protein [Planctomycetota bacterium]MDO8094382.1 hypothetical protein [Candidatus Brocadiales bacterium]